jgi:GWxTD domain-containing protein
MVTSPNNIISRTKLFAILAIMLVIASHQTLEAKRLNAFMSYTTFSSPETGPFIETYLVVAGNSAEFLLNENNKFQASIQVIILFKAGDEIANYDKYELFSPELDDTTNINFNFIDQQRYSLGQGVYDFELQIWDKNSEAKPYINLEPLTINYPEDEVTISGIQLIESYKKSEGPTILTKAGYDLIPFVVNYYPGHINTIKYYAEIYNTDKILQKDEKYLITCYISTIDRDKPFKEYVKYRRFQAEKVNVLLSEFDIYDLKSGNYFMTIEARDRENKLLAKNRIFFQRNNPRIQIRKEDISELNIQNTFAQNITNLDTLSYYIACLDPVADEQEKSFIMANKTSRDVETLQKFLYRFWYERNPLEPEKEWMHYLNEVNKVELAYSTSISRGYETDRGRVYLKYGPPNAISESYNEPATYPYEIWHYYELENGQRNKRFVFYTKDIVTNDFTQLHSDVSGELSNYRWQYILHQRVDPGFDIDQSVMPESWGGNSKRYFDLPR